MMHFRATLDVLPHKLGEFSEFVGKELVPCVGQYGMKLVGGWVNTVGKVNEITDQWCFESLERFGKDMAEMVWGRK
ncbi:NIPSNAP family protein [Chloroflexota bacterium]